jgi:hypothetical protein
MFRPLGFAGVLALAIFGLACSGEPPADELDAPAESSYGLVSISFERDAGTAAAEGLVLKTRAHFVRYTAMDAENVARLLALPLDPDRDLPGQDTCKVYDLTLDLDQDAFGENARHVELLDSGELRIQAASATSPMSLTLKPSHFAGLLPFMSGMVYAEAQSAADGERLGPVAVAADGGEAVGAFVAQVASPQVPRLDRIGGRAVTTAPVPRGSLELRWQPTSDPADVTFVELPYLKGERELVLRCQSRDNGAFEIPAALVAEAGTAKALDVVRLRRTFFKASGLDRGELRVTVRERVNLVSP